VPFGAEPRSNLAQGQARRAKFASARDRRLFARVNDKSHAVGVEGRAVDHGADEDVGRRVAVAFTTDAHDAAAFERHGGPDARCEYDVTGDPITPCDDEHPSSMLAQGRQRRT
jgi:hypothetical protein